MDRSRTVIATIVLAAIAVALGVWLWPEEPPPVEAAIGDSGMSPEMREAFMRTIGYVQ